MKQSEIKLKILLDEKKVPQRIFWEADDKDNNALEETPAMSLALWDDTHKNTLQINLWTDKMPADDLKRFYATCIKGMAQSILTATGDETISQEMENFSEKILLLIDHQK
ncbi:MAG: gliding motility protein GldC [Chitinophagaceae bacterium]|nr:gliding motility protein GldC [Chitinophagaceae bacterium]